MNDQALLSGLSEDELRSQNQKLRQAVSSLSLNFEAEKQKLVAKITDLDQKARLADVYEKKLEDIDLLIEEIDLKDSEL